MPRSLAPKSSGLPHSVQPPGRRAIIVGGGVVGQAIACQVQARAIPTLLIDPDFAPRGASWGNAGHIAVEQVEPLASRALLRGLPQRLFWRGGALSLPIRAMRRWLPFGIRLIAATRPSTFAAGQRALEALLRGAMPAWQRLLGQAGAPDLLRSDGHFVVWERPDTARAGAARWARTPTGGAQFRAATADEVRRIEALGAIEVAGAIRFTGSGQIADLGALAAALTAHRAAAGGARQQASATRLIVENDRARVLLDDGTIADADIIIVAAGARSGALLRPIGHSVPLIAERGYHIQSRETSWPADMPPVVFEDRSMIVTRFRSGLRAASFVEFADVDTPPDRRKWARLRRHVAQIGLSFDLPGEEWIGARPTLPDYLPAIGRSRHAANLFYAFGHQHLGLTLAAVTGEAMAALVAGDEPAIDLRPFDLDRFAGRA